MAELATLFAMSFVAAALAVALASLGNTAGGMTSCAIGRLIPGKKADARAVHWVRRYGAPVTALAWLPLVGYALSVAAGWLRMNWLAVLGFMAARRLARYIAVASLA